MTARVVPIGLIALVAVVVATLFGSVALADEGVQTAPRALPVHPVSPQYAEIKVAIDARAPGATSGRSTSTVTPSIGPSWQGLGASGSSPSDANGAMGPAEYIELVNMQIGVYSRSNPSASSSTNTEAGFTGHSSANGDGQIMWDPAANRFYFTMLNNTGSNSYDLLWGFSKGMSPSASASDWCTYEDNFGVYGTNQLPDYPKLGMTSDYLLIGDNHFTYNSGWTYVGSDIAWVSGATALGTGTLTSCPSGFATGVQQNLKNQGGTNASTPVVGRQTDPSSTGYVVGNEDPGSGTSTTLSVFSVTSGTGAPVFGGPVRVGGVVGVTPYAYPPSAPQAGTKYTLDTLDARLMNAWLAPDPSPQTGGAVALWTQHTVAASNGGLGAEVRWYEINPATGALFQSGIAQSPSLYVFDGAIAPDRQGASTTCTTGDPAACTTGAFGSNMALGVNTSSSSTYAALQVLTKVGINPLSGLGLVQNSTAPDTEFTCSRSGPCRWGDYAGASPDPAPGTTSEGKVWLSGMLSNGGLHITAAWRTWNWQVNP